MLGTYIKIYRILVVSHWTYKHCGRYQVLFPWKKLCGRNLEILSFSFIVSTSLCGTWPPLLRLRSSSSDFSRWRLQSRTQPPPSPPRLSLFVWVTTFVLSSRWCPASSYATASEALRIPWHYIKVGIPSGNWNILFLWVELGFDREGDLVTSVLFQDFLTLEEETDRFSQNVGKELPLYAA